MIYLDNLKNKIKIFLNVFNLLVISRDGFKVDLIKILANQVLTLLSVSCFVCTMLHLHHTCEKMEAGRGQARSWAAVRDRVEL